MVEGKSKRKAEAASLTEDELLPLPTLGLELASYTSEQLAMMPLDLTFDAAEDLIEKKCSKSVPNEDQRVNKRQKHDEIRTDKIKMKVPNIEAKPGPDIQINNLEEDGLMPIPITGLELASYTSEQLAMMPLEDC
mmetsp:Transcript_1977/g.2468  ORF Transcript_1977/g.2468 Transcript_1977/m.2468 type:complete len:135 (+) Transcript_1977:132-536(+)